MESVESVRGSLRPDQPNPHFRLSLPGLQGLECGDFEMEMEMKTYLKHAVVAVFSVWGLRAVVSGCRCWLCCAVEGRGSRPQIWVHVSSKV